MMLTQHLQEESYRNIIGRTAMDKEKEKMTQEQVDNILKLQALRLKLKLLQIQKIIDENPPEGKTKLDVLLEQFSLEDLIGSSLETVKNDNAKND
jgi:hypothetical protein